jgi:hypothetical protein
LNQTNRTLEIRTSRRSIEDDQLEGELASGRGEEIPYTGGIGQINNGEAILLQNIEQLEAPVGIINNQQELRG